jgi:hypothetical protein
LGFSILDFRFSSAGGEFSSSYWTLVFGFVGCESGLSKVLRLAGALGGSFDLGFRISDVGFRISDRGFRILAGQLSVGC